MTRPGGVNSRSPMRERFGLALHVLRGRPLIYRTRVIGRLEVVERNTRLVRCRFVPSEAADLARVVDETVQTKHYAEAERLLQKAKLNDLQFRPAACARLLARAQVHATLAIASSDVLNAAEVARAVEAAHLKAWRRS